MYHYERRRSSLVLSFMAWVLLLFGCFLAVIMFYPDIIYPIAEILPAPILEAIAAILISSGWVGVLVVISIASILFYINR